ncbi:hypothetical protein C5E45_34075 [Nocardia nova]|uniref:Uncharacterized protein n=1 Tax=Nocardia nova TaxID=37330 RepID=A0A2S6A8S3_9NOCA|nr:hypothetical protein [Nocardia nova]PPJ29715.1 hypothetical protein C5E45_34075 [Nocardia nova]
MSKEAVAYVKQLNLTDETARQVFLLLAEQTSTPRLPWDGGTPEIMGIKLTSADIPSLASQADLDPEAFRAQLRGLRQHVAMDVLEHSDGVWEIVYGPSYTKPRPQAVTEANVGQLHDFAMPGWDWYSTWGYEEGLGHYYAQIIHNSDDRDAEPRIWISPPQYVVRTIDELAQAIADALAPYEPICPPASIIKMYMTKPPTSR